MSVENNSTNPDIQIPDVSSEDFDARDQLPVQEIFPEETASAIPRRAISQELSNISGEISGAFGGRIGRNLMFAAYHQLEDELVRSRTELIQKNNKIDDLVSEVSKLTTKVSVQNVELRVAATKSRLSGFLYVLGSILFGIGWTQTNQPETLVGIGLIGLGIICMAVAFFLPIWSNTTGKQDD